MKTLTKIATGVLFAATIAFALNISGGDAYAKSRSSAGSTMVLGTGGIVIDLSTSTDPFGVLGITWE